MLNIKSNSKLDGINHKMAANKRNSTHSSVLKPGPVFNNKTS